MGIFSSDEQSSPYDEMEINRLNKRIAVLETAIRKHRDQKGDDRCWMDDEELYSVLPEGIPADHDRRLHSPCEMLEHCKQYIASRQPGGHEYVSVQRQIEELEVENKRLNKSVAQYAYQLDTIASLLGMEYTVYTATEIGQRIREKIRHLQKGA